MTIYGWDASHFDGNLTQAILDRARAEGYDFFTHKLAEGISDTEGTTDDTALLAARNAGFPFVGGYVIPRTQDTQSELDEWWYVLNASEPWWRDFPGWFNQIDLERWSYDNVSAAKGIELAKRWRDLTGRWTILYASHGQYGDELAAWDGPLWNADYVSGSNYASALYPGDSWQPLHGTWRGGWATYSGQEPLFLQFSSSATVAGLTVRDVNAYRGTVDDLRTLITGGSVAGDVTTWIEPYGAVDQNGYMAHHYLIALITGSKPFHAYWGVNPDGSPKDGTPQPNALWDLMRQLDMRDSTSALAKQLAAIAETLGAPVAVTVTQDQLNEAFLHALSDPGVQAGFAASFATHVKVD